MAESGWICPAEQRAWVDQQLGKTNGHSVASTTTSTTGPIDEKSKPEVYQIEQDSTRTGTGKPPIHQMIADKPETELEQLSRFMKISLMRLKAKFAEIKMNVDTAQAETSQARYRLIRALQLLDSISEDIENYQ